MESESSTNTESGLVRRGIVFKSSDFVQHLSLREQNPQVRSKRVYSQKLFIKRLKLVLMKFRMNKIRVLSLKYTK